MKFRILITFAIFALCLVSCRSKKSYIYLQNNEQYQSKQGTVDFEATIQPDDILNITVTSLNSEAAAPFNQNGQTPTSAPIRQSNYLVGKDGFIQFPVLGNIMVSGYKRTEFIEMMRQKLAPYVNDATVTLSITNFKVTILGEVDSPGVVSVTGDRITLLEVIAQSGDITVQGVRKNILIVRDNQGSKSFSRVDITRADFVDSPFYYLKQNDVVYVEARRTKIDSGAFGPYLGTLASVLGLVITTTLLLTRL